MAFQMLEIIFASIRVITAVVLLASAILSLRLISLYRGGALQKPWVLLIGGVVVFALAQPISTMSEVSSSDLLRMLGAVFSLLGSVSILTGIYNMVGVWKKFRETASSSVA